MSLELGRWHAWLLLAIVIIVDFKITGVLVKSQN